MSNFLRWLFFSVLFGALSFASGLCVLWLCGSTVQGPGQLLPVCASLSGAALGSAFSGSGRPKPSRGQGWIELPVLGLLIIAVMALMAGAAGGPWGAQRAAEMSCIALGLAAVLGAAGAVMDPIEAAA